MTLYLTALILGLTGSLHCLGMCGPILMILPWNQGSGNWTQSFLYHFSRIMVYVFLGAIFGMIGEGLVLFNVQQYISIITGVLIIVFLLGKKHFLKPLYALNQKLQHRFKGFQGNKRTVSMGVLNGLMPCGLVYAAGIASINQTSTVEGMLFMFLFGIGTLPLLVTLSHFKSFFSKTFFKNRVSTVMMIAIAAIFILRGLNLGIPYVSPAISAKSEKVSCH